VQKQNGSTTKQKIAFYAGALLQECEVLYTNPNWPNPKDLLVGTCTNRYYLAGRRVDEARDIRDSKWNSTRKFPFGEDALTSGSYTEEDHFASYRGAGDSVAIDYARHRSYAPTLGTFTSPDPYEASGGLESPASWNRFAYVEGDPIGLNDPNGLEACKTPNLTNMSCGTNPSTPSQFQADKRGPASSSPYEVWTNICFMSFCTYVRINGSSTLGRQSTGELALGESNYKIWMTIQLELSRLAQTSVKTDDDKKREEELFKSLKAVLKGGGFSVGQDATLGDVTRCSSFVDPNIGSGGTVPAFALIDTQMRIVDVALTTLRLLAPTDGSGGTDTFRAFRDEVQRILGGGLNTGTRSALGESDLSSLRAKSVSALQDSFAACLAK
jgi:RHS repeat-associated protein